MRPGAEGWGPGCPVCGRPTGDVTPRVNVAIPDEQLPDGAVHAFWDDLVVDELSSVRDFIPTGVGVIPAPLTPPFVESWARLFDRQPTPSDVRALVYLDRVARYPEG